MPKAEVAEYRKHWRERAEQEVALQRELASKARAEAMRVAQVLVRDYGARRVYLYGSLAQEDGFRQQSDVDLAVEGIAPHRFFKVWAAAGAHSRFPIDLVDMDEVGETMRELILEYGELLCESATD